MAVLDKAKEQLEKLGAGKFVEKIEDLFKTAPASPNSPAETLIIQRDATKKQIEVFEAAISRLKKEQEALDKLIAEKEAEKPTETPTEAKAEEPKPEINEESAAAHNKPSDE